MIDQKANMMVDLYSHYDKQILPFSGGLMNQPNYFVEAMTIIGNHLNVETQ